MNEKKEYLKEILKTEFLKYTKSPMKIVGRCHKIIGIAQDCGLGFDYVAELKAIYLDTFKTEYAAK